MDTRRELLKPSRFGNAEKRRLLENKMMKEKRSIRRTRNFNINRDIDFQENENIIPDKVVDRKIALQKFRAEKEAQKKAIQAKKKPPFLVGIPHHGSSPLMRNVTADTMETKAKTTFEFSFQPPNIIRSAKKLTSPHTPTVLKRSAQKKPLKNVSNLVNKLEKGCENSHSYDADEELAAPLGEVEGREMLMEEVAVGKTNDAEKRNKTPDYVSPRATRACVVERIKDEINETPDYVSPRATRACKVDHNKVEIIDSKGEDVEVATQHARLQSETTRLLELADQWQGMALHEKLPQDVVDDVDSIVGQTRLLTSDKFQQFRRLIVQFEEKTGTHPVTLDDLNGFWDMVYLQVESLDKKYAALDILKNNNWVRPEPPSKKKRRPAKRVENDKGTRKEKPSTSAKEPECNLLQLPEGSLQGDQQPQTSSTDMNPVVSSLLFSRKRTRSNSPSPYIAMRLSGVGRNLVQPLGTDETPRSLLLSSVKVEGTPKSTLQKSRVKLESTRSSLLSAMTPVEVKIEEGVEETEPLTATGTEEHFMPVFTPRRSIRLMTKMQATPASCTACQSASCERSKCKTKRSPRMSSQAQKKAVSPLADTEQECKTKSIPMRSPRMSSRSQKKAVSPLAEAEPELGQPEMIDITKPSTSGVKFSLRPSILTVCENKNVSEIPKKAKKRKQPSVCSASTTSNAEQNDGWPKDKIEVKSQRSTRQSRKVTFESGATEKISFKLPATPYRKHQADS